MCGRFAIYSSVEAIVDYAKTINRIEKIQANYNVAPGQNIPVVLFEDQGRIIKLMRWGLVPFWAKEAKMGYRLINARAETVADKPSFRRAFKRNRCLIIANGFYEWRKSDKQPYYIYPRDTKLFAFAGIWEEWNDPEGQPLHTCSIITTEPNEFMKKIHERMPVILPQQDEDFWISSEIRSPEILLSLLKPFPGAMEAYPVSKEVNSTRNNHQKLVEPVNPDNAVEIY